MANVTLRNNSLFMSGTAFADSLSEENTQFNYEYGDNMFGHSLLGSENMNKGMLHYGLAIWSVSVPLTLVAALTEELAFVAITGLIGTFGAGMTAIALIEAMQSENSFAASSFESDQTVHFLQPKFEEGQSGLRFGVRW